ncbi:MAG: 4-hydroxybenzoate octaprenyltransferase [Betaproteobacteria bacterium]|nr:4-hydroxybenzoate octaprenyltransferase [Betaproteobacteria bacterium]
MTWQERFNAYEKLMRLDKPIGILLLLWPALWGLWFVAQGIPDHRLLLIFVVGTVIMRSAGCIVNDLADRNFDSRVERTRHRPLAAGLVAPKEAVALGGALFLVALMLALKLNRLTILLAVIAFGMTLIYPFLKRFFPFPQAWLGLAFGMSIPMAYAAYINFVPIAAWFMMLANMFWAIAYDTEYAMVDRDDDLKVGLNSSAILLGRYDVAGVMLSHAIFLFMMVVAGTWYRLGVVYYLGIGVALLLAGYQAYLIRGRGREQCFRAFRNNNWVGMAIFAGLALDLYLRTGAAG